MRNKTKMLAGVLGLMGMAATASAISLDIASLGTGGGSSVGFSGGGSFTFNNNTLTELFQVGSSDTAPFDAVGLVGTLSGGSWSIGSVSSLGAGVFRASVGSAPETLTIKSGPETLTATLDFSTITAIVGPGGVGGFIAGGLKSIMVSGPPVNSNLGALAAAGAAAVSLSFSFTDTGKDLAYLKTHGITDTFQGQVTTSVPDGGLTAMLLGFALIGVEGLRRKLA